jgi:hypothetical protein
MSATSALTVRALADSRARTASFALLFAAVAAAQVVGYRDTYPTPTASRSRGRSATTARRALLLCASIC